MTMLPQFTPDNKFLDFLLLSMDEDKIDPGANELVDEMRNGNLQVKALYDYLREYLDKEFEKYKNGEY
jgi:hypothetical protein